MIEENVVSAANTTHRTTIEELDRLIRDAGFRPARRRQDYSIIPADSLASASAPVAPVPVLASAGASVGVQQPAAATAAA
jgi:cyclic dehypoxanthinyl futalosine synthase